jgi:hypothetical protein
MYKNRKKSAPQASDIHWKKYNIGNGNFANGGIYAKNIPSGFVKTTKASVAQNVKHEPHVNAFAIDPRYLRKKSAQFWWSSSQLRQSTAKPASAVVEMKYMKINCSKRVMMKK